MSWDKKNIETTNWFNKKYYENVALKVKKHDDDDQQDKRLKNLKCKCCYYLKGDMISGQAFTTSQCENCGVDISNPTTSTNKICEKCSKEHNLCVKCGGNLD